jgi:hypothetical protein
MSADEILAAQSPIAGWSPGRRSAPTRGRRAALRLRRSARRDRARAADIRAGSGRAVFRDHPATRRVEAMGLGPDTDLHGLRKRYSTLVRRYHPDRNGGDRSHEGRLQRVVEAYQLLRKAAAFA